MHDFTGNNAREMQKAAPSRTELGGNIHNTHTHVRTPETSLSLRSPDI